MVSKSQIIFCSILFLFSSCNFLDDLNQNSQRDKKSFYDYYEDGDILRIPLVEPYIVYSANSGEDWVFDVPFGNILKGLQVSNIKSIHVDNHLIFLYSDLISLPGETTSAWLVFDIKNETSQYFTDYDILIKDFPEAINMESTKKIFVEFKKSRNLPWK